MATPEAEAQRRQAALAVGGSLVVGYGGVQVAEVPPAAARAAAAGTVLAALVAFLTEQRLRAVAWLRERMVARGPANAIEEVLAQESLREEEFARRAAERFARDITVALAIPDRESREAAIRGLVSREERYARQRSMAMAARAFAALDRVVLQHDSPQGAFWKLDPTVVEHTAGCLVMGNRFWPHAVLRRVHPPRHAGCPCRLLGFGEAVALGLMGAGDVPDVRTAVRRAAAVVMEGVLVLDDDVAAVGLIEEAYGSVQVAELRQALIGAGLTTAERFDALVP